MLIFMTMIIVVLLNILIAQLTDTYMKIQNKAEKQVMASKVEIITRYEKSNTMVLPHVFRKLCRCSWIPGVLKNSVKVSLALNSIIYECINKITLWLLSHTHTHFFKIVTEILHSSYQSIMIWNIYYKVTMTKKTELYGTI